MGRRRGRDRGMGRYRLNEMTGCGIAINPAALRLGKRYRATSDEHGVGQEIGDGEKKRSSGGKVGVFIYRPRDRYQTVHGNSINNITSAKQPPQNPPAAVKLNMSHLQDR